MIKYDNITSAIKIMYQQEGLIGFTKGFTARFLWMVPWMSISQTIFDQLYETY